MGGPNCQNLDYIAFSVVTMTAAAIPVFNPVLYWYMNEDFRRDLKQLVISCRDKFFKILNTCKHKDQEDASN